jgi:hypothetical protein
MENDKPLSAASDEDLARLAQTATDREEDAPPPPPVANNFFWRSLAVVGPYLGYCVAGLTLVAFLLGWLGGESFAWASYLSIPILIFLLLYIAYLLRRRMQERAATYLENHLRQEQARLEVARLVLEQSHKNNKDKN